MPGKRKSPEYSIDLVRDILDASLEPGANIRKAAEARGVVYSTLWGWIQRDPEARKLQEENQAKRRELARPAWKGHGQNRPPTINLDLINATLDLIRYEGMTLTQAAARLGKNHGDIWGAIFRRGLQQDYRDAMQAGSHMLAESTLEILDDDSGDIIEQPDGRFLVNGAKVKRDQARASQRMVLAARANPEYYGPPTASRAPAITINIDSDKLQRIRDVSGQTLTQIAGDGSDGHSSNS